MSTRSMTTDIATAIVEDTGVRHAIVIVSRPDGVLEIGMAGHSEDSKPIVDILRVIRDHVDAVQEARGKDTRTRTFGMINGVAYDPFAEPE